jgi:glycerate 2-kinase
MKIVIAPDSFKGSLDALSVARAIDIGVRGLYPEAGTILCPLTDGGEGSAEIWASYMDAKKVWLNVQDPLGRVIESHYYLSNDGLSAIIESSLAAGLTLLSFKEQNPSMTSTYGVGQMIDHAIFTGAKQIYLALGGTSTNDMGVGMASALGYEFSAEIPNDVAAIGNNLSLIQYFCINEFARNRIRNVKFYALCDVNNPLFGPQGAAAIYAPQKGADVNMVQLLDQGLRDFDNRCIAHHRLNLSVIPAKALNLVKGSGAAGGLGYGAMYFLGAELVRGIDALLDISEFDVMINDADLIITGEGRLDQQTLNGKVIAGVCTKARARNIPVMAVCGQNLLTVEETQKLGLLRIISLEDKQNDTVFAIENAYHLIVKKAMELVSYFKFQ